MLLTISTTHEPATDLGYLVHKNPSRSQGKKLPFGTVHMFYPEANRNKCTLAILMEIDPLHPARGKGGGAQNAPLAPYVNDRPYVCSSFMSIALSRLFGQTLNGTCREKAEELKKLLEKLGYRICGHMEGLECFVGKEPLSRVHECVFGVLALESETVDPRL